MDRRDGKGLAELMAELGKLEGLEWMRILYAYPSYFSDELINEIANNPKVRRFAQQACLFPVSLIAFSARVYQILRYLYGAPDGVVIAVWSVYGSAEALLKQEA